MTTPDPTPPDATATPRTDFPAYLADTPKALQKFESMRTRRISDMTELWQYVAEQERELTAAKAEIARLERDLEFVAGVRDRHIAMFNDEQARAERAEAQLRERTQWQCACGGTDCAGKAENERLRAEVERLKDDLLTAHSAKREYLARIETIGDALCETGRPRSHTDILAKANQLRARVADLENDLEKSKHEADDWHRAWETVTEQAKKEVAELEQALSASATKAAAEYGEQLKPLFAKVRELEQDKARLDWLEAIYGNLRISTLSGSAETLRHVWDTRRTRKLIDAARKGAT